MQLSAAGLRVVCIEPEEATRQAVGESLDWSAPDLLNALGLPMEDLVKGGLATWKRHVTVKLRDGASEHYVPGAWLAKAPFHVELRTMHVDRLRLDEELLKRTLASGVTMLRNTVVKVERDGERVVAVHTAEGARFSSPWFIDASGFASSLLPREFDLPAIEFGPPRSRCGRICVSESVEGTKLYMEPTRAEYLDWVWEIPIVRRSSASDMSLPARRPKANGERGLSVEDIFRHQLLKFPRFEALIQADLSDLSERDFISLARLRRRRRHELARRRRSCVDGGSDHRERSDGRAAARAEAAAIDFEIPQTRHAAAAGEDSLTTAGSCRWRNFSTLESKKFCTSRRAKPNWRRALPGRCTPHQPGA